MMKQFDLIGFNPETNLLPYEGEVHYHGAIMSTQAADVYMRTLLDTIPWQHDEAKFFGKHIITARKVAWVGDAQYSYTYSGTTKHAIAWTSELLTLKSIVETITKTAFNSCLLNLYHNGMEGMGWHSDDEVNLGKVNTIASISFGAIRKFAFKHKRTKETISLMLEPGSLLVMQGETQKFWHHSLLKSARIHEPRVNLTFRTIKTEIM